MQAIQNFISQYGLILFRIEMIYLILLNLYLEFICNRWRNSDYYYKMTIKCFTSIASAVLLLTLSFFYCGLTLLRIASVLWFFRVLWKIFNYEMEMIGEILLPLITCVALFVMTFFV